MKKYDFVYVTHGDIDVREEVVNLSEVEAIEASNVYIKNEGYKGMTAKLFLKSGNKITLDLTDLGWKLLLKKLGAKKLGKGCK